MTRVRTLSASVVVVVAVRAVVAAQSPQPIRIMTSGAFTAALSELSPQVERETGLRIEAIYGASMGNSPEAIPNRLKRGEPADIVIMAASALDDLIAHKLVAAGSRVDLVRSTIAMAVRSGA